MTSAAQKLVYYLKALYIVGAVIVSASYGVIASVVLSLLRRRGLAQYTTGRLFYYLAYPVLRIGFRFVGSDNNYERLLSSAAWWSGSPQFLRPCVVLSNHQSALDVYMLGKLFPPYCSVTSKASLQWVPFLGWFMTLSGTVFLNRRDSRASLATLSSAADSVLARDRQSVFVFPEGTRSGFTAPGLLTPLKKGAFHLAVQAQLPIVPVAISNTSNLFDATSHLLRPGTIKVKVLDPVSTAGLTRDDVPALTARVEALLEAAVEELGYSEVRGIHSDDTSEASDSSDSSELLPVSETTKLTSAEPVDQPSV